MAMGKTLQKIAKIREKTPFLAISVFRPVDRNFGRNVSADFDRNFGRNFGFGRTLFKVLLKETFYKVRINQKSYQ